MRIRFYNAEILTMTDPADPTAIVSGELHTDGDRIEYVGCSEDAPEVLGSWDKEIDCEGNLLMPGFKDAHTHSAMTFIRSNADDLPLQRWLSEQIYPAEAKITPDDVYWLSKLAILEYLTGGITAAMDMYLTPVTIDKAFRESGMRLVQVSGINDFTHSVEAVEEYFLTLNSQNPLTSFRLGFHGEYTCSEKLLEGIAELSHKYRAPVFAHISETKDEVFQCIDRYGKTPVAFLADKGLFDFGGAGYHMVHTTPDDISIMKEKKISVVTNPGSNTKLASGIAPISDYRRAGITVGIGTDGPASNNCLDMFREMFLVTGLAKLRESDASAIPAGEVLRMACCEGAHIMTIPDADCLAAGKLADLIMIDLNMPNMQPLNSIANNIVYSGSKDNVCMTMVGGRILYDKFSGKAAYHIEAEPAEIYAKAQEIRNRVLG